MAPTHRAKRQYDPKQSSITSFFNRTSNTQNNDTISTGFPVQPNEVQAGLLAVGMRVRKAVPSGYKTGTYNALSTVHDTITPTPAEPEALTQVVNDAGSRRVFGTNIRELAPFCGLNKVGGLAQQIMPSDEYSPFISSQESQASNVSLESLGAGKRRFDDGEDGEEISVFSQEVFERWLREEEVSQKSKPMGLGMRIDGRPIAVPKTRRKRADGMEASTDSWEQENSMDFGEAEFLDYGHWTDKEVDMNDV